MPPRNRPRHRHHASPEAFSFDALAKRVASRTIARGQAIKLAGAALVATLVGGSVAPEEAAAATDRACKNQPALSNKQCLYVSCSATNDDCQCTKTVNGDNRCVNLGSSECPTTDECDRNRHCRGGEVCAKVGGCCEGVRNNLCAPLCTD